MIIIIIIITIIIIIKKLMWRCILINTVQSAPTQRSHWRTLAKNTNSNVPTVHARTKTNRREEREDLRMCDKRCALRFDLNELRVGV